MALKAIADRSFSTPIAQGDEQIVTERGSPKLKSQKRQSVPAGADRVPAVESGSGGRGAAGKHFRLSCGTRRDKPTGRNFIGPGFDMQTSPATFYAAGK